MATHRKRKAKGGVFGFEPEEINFIAGVLRNMGINVDNVQAQPVAVSPIPAEMFKKMLFLCHPDKHNNHPHAVEVTQWLLNERKKQK